MLPVILSERRTSIAPEMARILFVTPKRYRWSRDPPALRPLGPKNGRSLVRHLRKLCLSSPELMPRPRKGNPDSFDLGHTGSHSASSTSFFFDTLSSLIVK